MIYSSTSPDGMTFTLITKGDFNVWPNDLIKAILEFEATIR